MTNEGRLIFAALALLVIQLLAIACVVVGAWFGSGRVVTLGFLIDGMVAVVLLSQKRRSAG